MFVKYTGNRSKGKLAFLPSNCNFFLWILVLLEYETDRICYYQETNSIIEFLFSFLFLVIVVHILISI